MRKYIFDGDLNQLPREDYDVIIAGSGVAGLYAALNLSPALNIAVLNKSGVEISNSWYAQGGIAAAVEMDDSVQSHFDDTMVAGDYLCDEQAVRVLVENGPNEIARLVDMGVPFDRDELGRLHVTREGAHSHNRIVHCGGDATGLGVTKRLSEIASGRSNLHFRQGVCIADVLRDEAGRTTGVVGLIAGEWRYFAAPCVILCSGGIGRVYRNSTNARPATGDGIAAAARAGATLNDMEFVQFHPTALIHPDENGRFFLISEALRGEGAVLRNRRWERFMQGAHLLMELAPRDVVTRAIVREMRKYDLPHVYLDITHRPRSFLAARFPTVYEGCMSRGIDIARDWIPVIPVQHYFMGGVRTDTWGATDVPGLFVCGEAANTGVHGANRLASNSLLECLVFSRRCAEQINASPVPQPGQPVRSGISQYSGACEDLDAMRTEIRGLMTRQGGIIRNEKGMTEALGRVQDMLAQLEEAALPTQKAVETLNMASIAKAVLEAALKRKKSVGAHFRDDE